MVLHLGQTSLAEQDADVVHSSMCSFSDGVSLHMDWQFGQIIPRSLLGMPSIKKTVYLVSCAQFQGIPTPLPLIVTNLIVTNV